MSKYAWVEQRKPTLVFGFDLLYILDTVLKFGLCLLQLSERVREVVEFLKKITVLYHSNNPCVGLSKMWFIGLTSSSCFRTSES